VRPLTRGRRFASSASHRPGGQRRSARCGARRLRASARSPWPNSAPSARRACASPARVTARRSATSSGAWSAEEAAVANEVAPGDVLAGGRPVKVAITEPYVAGYW